jgi:hypothetical protein
MQIVNKTDHLITDLNKLEPIFSDDSKSNEKKFNDLLSSSIATGQTIANEEIGVALPTNAKLESKIPSWVNPDFDYDPKSPRKPNKRELIEAISGQSLERLYAENHDNWQKISRQASDMLYGVVGANEDTRDWASIMNSSNILTEAREQTGAMYEPEVDIQSNFNNDGVLTEQIAVIKDNKGNTLRSLSSDITSAEETLINFGATRETIPTNLQKRITPEKFDDGLLAFLKNFGNNATSIQQVVLQSASEVIANKVSQEIPLDELSKL